jgi:hypothetical protein
MIEFSSFTSVFELCVGLNFAYAGLDSFSENILFYVYLKLEKISNSKNKLNELSIELNEAFVSDFFDSDENVNRNHTEKLKDTFKNKREKINQLQRKIDNLKNSDTNKIKHELYKDYDKNKYKPLFFLNGFYFFILLLNIGIIEASNICNFRTSTLNSMLFLCIIYIVFNIVVGYIRFNKELGKYTSIKKYVFILIGFTLLSNLFFAFLGDSLYFYWICCVDISPLFVYFLVFLNLCLLLIPFLFETFSLNTFISNKFISDLENDVRNGIVDIKDTNESFKSMLENVKSNLK